MPESQMRAEQPATSSPPRLTRLESLFHRALDVAPEARADWLASACTGDTSGLRDALEAMLAADGEQLTVIDQLHQRAQQHRTVADRATTPPELGLLLGPYRLTHQIGEGGMSMVYRAQRVDDRFDKAVAVKVLKAEIDDPLTRERFRAECRILAALEHPSIARLFDAGELADGTPYVVLELVEGEPIHQYCDHHGLTVDARLSLFEAVCAAVDHAHRHLVIHRDLKPSNILVTTEGVAKLLDFGIAKLLDTEGGVAAESPATLTRLQPMTPQYASPEQVRGQPVSTASDTFALGVLLYRLLTGRLPYRFEARSLRDIEEYEDRVRGIEPPSAVLDSSSAEAIATLRGTSPDRLRRTLRGNLDAILTKALRPEPGHRYQSAVLLADDLRRHRAHLPVRARVGTVHYRLGTFLRRHRLGLGLVVVFLAMLAALAQSLASRSILVGRERDRAEHSSSFLLGLFEVHDPDSRAGPETVRKMLDQGVNQIAARHALTSDERATLLDTLGMLYRKIGDPVAAVPLFEQSLALRQELFGARHPDVATSQLHLAYSLLDSGQLDRGTAFLDQGIALRRQLLGPEDPLVAEALRAKGTFVWNQGNFAGGESLLREAIGIWRKSPEDRPRPEMAIGLADLGSLLHFLGRDEEAEPLLIESWSLLRRWYGEEHPLTARSLTDLASFYRGRGHLEEAEARFREGLRVVRRFRTEGHPDITFLLNGLGQTLEEAGKLDEAEVVMREHHALIMELAWERPEEKATAMNNLASVLRKQGLLDESETLFRRSMAIRLDTMGPIHALSVQSRFSLGALLHQRGNTVEALALLEQSDQTSSAAGLADDHPARSFIKVGLARLLVDLGRNQEAEAHARQALAIARSRFVADHWRVASAELVLAACLVAQGKSTEAQPFFAHGRPVLERLGAARSFELDWSEKWMAKE